MFKKNYKVNHDIKLTPEQQKQADGITKLQQEGEIIVDKAVEESLDYFDDLMENISDVNWRAMAAEQHALEIGVGVTLAERVVPLLYEKMKRTMGKRVGMPQEAVDVMVAIMIGRVIKNVRRAMNERDSK